MIIDAPLTSERVAPLIDTGRLRLRPHQLSDVADCVAMWADPEIGRYTIGYPAPPSRTWLRILGYRGHWALLGFGYWAIEERASSRFVGEAGFADFRRDRYPAILGMPELGWAVASCAQGKGYATEGLRAIVAWGDRHFGSRRTACIIHPDNHRSFRVADKLGYCATQPPSADEDSDAILVRAPLA